MLNQILSGIKHFQNRSRDANLDSALERYFQAKMIFDKEEAEKEESGGFCSCCSSSTTEPRTKTEKLHARIASLENSSSLVNIGEF